MFAYFVYIISIYTEPLICRDDLEGRGDRGIRPDSVLTGGVWGRRRFTSTSPDLRQWTDGGEIALFGKDVQFILVNIRARENWLLQRKGDWDGVTPQLAAQPLTLPFTIYITLHHFVPRTLLNIKMKEPKWGRQAASTLAWNSFSDKLQLVQTCDQDQAWGVTEYM